MFAANLLGQYLVTRIPRRNDLAGQCISTAVLRKMCMVFSTMFYKRNRDVNMSEKLLILGYYLSHTLFKGPMV